MSMVGTSEEQGDAEKWTFSDAGDGKVPTGYREHLLLLPPFLSKVHRSSHSRYERSA